ncbi:MAG: ATP-binding protein, partial [Candidatus Omnitrophota bacterium]
YLKAQGVEKVILCLTHGLWILPVAQTKSGERWVIREVPGNIKQDVLNKRVAELRSSGIFPEFKYSKTGRSVIFLITYINGRAVREEDRQRIIGLQRPSWMPTLDEMWFNFVTDAVTGNSYYIDSDAVIRMVNRDLTAQDLDPLNPPKQSLMQSLFGRFGKKATQKPPAAAAAQVQPQAQPGAGDVVHTMAVGAENIPQADAVSNYARAANESEKHYIERILIRYDVHVVIVLTQAELDALAIGFGIQGNIGEGFGYRDDTTGEAYSYILKGHEADHQVMAHEITEALGRTIKGTASAGARKGGISPRLQDQEQTSSVGGPGIWQRFNGVADDMVLWFARRFNKKAPGKLSIKKSDILREPIGNDTEEEEILSYLNDAHRFLAPDHWLVKELQQYIDRMAEPGMPPNRLLIAIDGTWPLACSVGQNIIISLSLIAALDTIDEVVAVLAHEQAHPELNMLGHSILTSNDLVKEMISDISMRRLHEHAGDVSTQKKLKKLGLNIMALGSALKNIAGARSQQDITHGNVSRRILALLVSLKYHDYEHGDNLDQGNLPIPATWKPVSIKPDIEERLSGHYGRDFKEAVSQAPIEAISKMMRSLLKSIADHRFTTSQERRKYVYVLDYLSGRADQIAKEKGLEKDKADIIFLSWLVYLQGGYFYRQIDELNSSRARFREARYVYSLVRKKTLSLLRQTQKYRALENFRQVSGVILNNTELPSYSIWSAIDFATSLLIADDDLGREFLGEGFDINNESFLTIFNDYFKAASSLNPGLQGFDSRAQSLSEWLKNVVRTYMLNFGEQNEPSEENLLLVIDQLRQAELIYADLFGIGNILSTLFDYGYDFRRNLTRFAGGSKTEDELKELLLGVKNMDLERCLEVLRAKNEAGFLNYLKDDPDTLKDLLGGMSDEVKTEVRRAFESDPELSTWVAGCLEKFWHQETFIIEEEGALESTYADMPIQDVRQMKQFIFGLDIINRLNFKDTYEKKDTVKRYLESDQALALYSRLPLDCLSHIITEISGLDLNKSDTAKLDGDWLIGLTIFRIARERAIKVIQDSGPEQARLASDTYWRVIKDANKLYRGYEQSQKYLRIVGDSEIHSQWLLPLSLAYHQYIEANFDAFIDYPQSAMQLFFELEALFPESAQRKQILNLYACRLIDHLSDSDLREFLLNLAREAKITKEIYDYFLQKRVHTREQLNSFKEARDSSLRELISSGDVKLSGMVLADTVMDYLLQEKKAIEIFEALFDNEEGLRRRMIYPWFVQALARGKLMGYAVYGSSSKNNDGKTVQTISVAGPGANQFMPFDEFMDNLYSASDLARLAMLEKLLLGPNGLLHAKAGQRAFVRVLKKYVPVDSGSAETLADIAAAAVETIDPEHVFLAIVPSLTGIILQRKIKKQQSENDMKALASALSDGISGAPTAFENMRSFSEIKYYKKSAFEEFLGIYRHRPASNEAWLRVAQLTDSLTGRIGSSLGMAISPSLGLDILPRAPSQIIDIILKACQSLGPMGYRFLQIYGQYVDIPAQMQDRFLDVYDSSEGQDKFSFMDTLFEIAKSNPIVRKFVEEDLVSVNEKLGGGSILTVYKVTVRNRDADGRLTYGTHQEVLKIRVPNAELLVNETADKLLEVVGRLQRSAHGKDKRYYLAAERVLRDVREWVINDIRDKEFLKIDELYRQAHQGYAASNGLRVVIAEAMEPNNKDVKREAYVPGPTLNKILKWKSSGKSVAELVSEETDVGLREFLVNLQSSGQGLDGILRQATSALVEDYARLLTNPATNRSGEDVYILHSDMHFGNVIMSPDLKTVYPIDRNFYLQLTKKDVEFIRSVITRDKVDAKRMLNEILDYFLGLPQNSGSNLNQGALSAARRNILLISIGAKVLLQNNRDPFTVMAKVLQELEMRGIEIPLPIRIMFKNLLSLNSMLRYADAGSLGDYIKNSGQHIISIPQAQPPSGGSIIGAEAGAGMIGKPVNDAEVQSMRNMPDMNFGPDARYEVRNNRITFAGVNMPVLIAGDVWFKDNGITENAVVVSYTDAQGNPRQAVVVRQGASGEERSAALHHELIAIMEVAGIGVRQSETESALGDSMARTDSRAGQTASPAAGQEQASEAAAKDNAYVTSQQKLYQEANISEESLRRRHLLASAAADIRKVISGHLQNLLGEPVDEADINIAIVPLGSTLKGYAAKGSDIDFAVYILPGSRLGAISLDAVSQGMIINDIGKVLNKYQIKSECLYISDLFGFANMRSKLPKAEDMAYLFLPVVHADSQQALDEMRKAAIEQIGKLNSPESYWREVQETYLRWILATSREAREKPHLLTWMNLQGYSESKLEEFNQERKVNMGLPDFGHMQEALNATPQQAPADIAINLASALGFLDSERNGIFKDLTNVEFADLREGVRLARDFEGVIRAFEEYYKEVVVITNILPAWRGYAASDQTGKALPFAGATAEDSISVWLESESVEWIAKNVQDLIAGGQASATEAGEILAMNAIPRNADAGHKDIAQKCHDVALRLGGEVARAYESIIIDYAEAFAERCRDFLHDTKPDAGRDYVFLEKFLPRSVPEVREEAEYQAILVILAGKTELAAKYYSDGEEGLRSVFHLVASSGRGQEPTSSEILTVDIEHDLEWAQRIIEGLKYNINELSPTLSERSRIIAYCKDLISKLPETSPAIKTLNSVIDSVGQFSRRLEKLVLDREDVVLVNIEDRITVVQRASNHRHQIELDVAPDDQALSIFADPDMLCRVFANIIKNAFEAEAGIVQIAMRKEGSNIIITIKDNGKGMPEEVRQRIFDRDYTHNKAGGTGLGLDIVRTYMESIGGTVNVDSHIGRGTAFTLIFPADLAGQARRAKIAGSNKLDLVVGIVSHAESAEALQRALKEAGIKVYTEQASEILAAWQGGTAPDAAVAQANIAIAAVRGVIGELRDEINAMLKKDDKDIQKAFTELLARIRADYNAERLVEKFGLNSDDAGVTALFIDLYVAQELGNKGVVPWRSIAVSKNYLRALAQALSYAQVSIDGGIIAINAQPIKDEFPSDEAGLKDYPAVINNALVRESNNGVLSQDGELLSVVVNYLKARSSLKERSGLNYTYLATLLLMVVDAADPEIAALRAQGLDPRVVKITKYLQEAGITDVTAHQIISEWQGGMAPDLGQPAAPPVMSAKEAIDFYNRHTPLPMFVIKTEGEKDEVVKLLEELEKLPIQNVLIAGDAMPKLHFLLALMGKNITFADLNESKVDNMKRMLGLINANLKKEGRASIEIEFYAGDIGNFVSPQGVNFDLITFIDLVGGIPKGGIENWLKTARRLLNDEGYIIVDDTDAALQGVKM